MKKNNIFANIDNLQQDEIGCNSINNPNIGKTEGTFFPNSSNMTLKNSNLNEQSIVSSSKKIKNFYSRLHGGNEDLSQSTFNLSKVTPIQGENYTSKDLKKLDTVYNSRNTKCLKGFQPEVFTHSLAKGLNYDPVRSCDFKGFGLEQKKT